METCLVGGCGQKEFAAGYCSKHYNRLRTTGTTADGPKARGAVETRFWKYVDVRGDNECWLWTAKSRVRGYGVISLGGARGKKMLAHRVAWTLANGPLPEIDGHHGAVVMHTCDNRLCCNPAHLLVGTQGDNVVDMDRKGRRINAQLNGERHHNAKITEDDVRSIRADTRGNVEVAAQYGLSRQNVRYIRNRTAWKHVQ